MPNPISLILRGIRDIGLRPTWDSFVHALRTRWTEAKFADPERPLRGLSLLRKVLERLPEPPGAFPPPGPVTRRVGRLVSHTRDERTVSASFANATLYLTVLAPDLIHVRTQPADVGASEVRRRLSSFFLARPDAAWSPCPFNVVEAPEALEIHTEQLVCAIAREDGRVTIRDSNGGIIADQAASPGWTARQRSLYRWSIPSDARFYGLGQRTLGLNLRGESCVNWNTDPRTYGDGDDPINLCIPFLVALHSQGRQGYGLLLDSTARSRVDLGRTDPQTLSIEVDERDWGYYFFYGPDLVTVLERYTELTGRHPLFPLWTLGYHQSRWSYYPESRVRQLAHDFRHTHNVPCDGIHLDIHYMDGYRCFTWDRQHFPNPGGLIADLHAEGFKVVTILDPGIKSDREYAVFREGLTRDAFCRYPDGRTFIGPVWPGNCAFPDFINSKARDWWGDLHRDLIQMGVDGIWDDMNEPALFGEDGATIPDPILHDLDGEEVSHRYAHNIYGLAELSATAEALERLLSERRPFLLTRSGWAGLQRYAAHWTGDNHSTWESLRLTLPMVLGLGLSGVAFTGADIGGFAGPASGELFTRWLQLGIFLPFLRAHTAQFTPDQEPWSWGEPFLNIARETIRLRYRLLPYLYTALWQCTRTGIPMARPLALAFQRDPATHGLEDEFLCGDALLVAPVLEQGATRRSVYLPAGEWYDFWSRTRHQGPTEVEVDAPLERVPLFVRAGSVVPMWPAMDYVGQETPRALILHVYPGERAERVSWLYEDDGESKAHRQGAWRCTRFHLRADAEQLDLTRTVEGDFDPNYARFEIVVHGVDGAPEAVEGLTEAQVSHDAQERTLRLTGAPFAQLSLRW